MKTNGRPPLRPVPAGHRVQAPQHPGITGDVPDVAPKASGLDLLEGARALGLWVLLERPPMNDEKSEGGIILPDAVREKPHWTVRSIGEKVTLKIAVGDHVAFDGTRIMEDAQSGRAWCFAMEGQLMGVVDPEKLKNRIITQRYAP